MWPRLRGAVAWLTLKKAAISAALLLGALLAGTALTVYFSNRELLDAAEKRNRATASIDWNDGASLSAKLVLLQASLDHLREHDRQSDHRAPLGIRGWLYSADEVYTETVETYAAQLAKGVLSPCRSALQERLEKADPSTDYFHTRTTLKQYLMLREIEHVDADWASARYTRLWVELMEDRSDVTPSELKEMVRPHAQHFFELLERGEAPPLELDDVLIERVRRALRAAPVGRRNYEMLVRSLHDEWIDEAGETAISNMLFPPIRLPMIFRDRPDVLKYFQSKSFIEGTGYTQVDGPFTDKGHYGARRQMEAAAGLLKAEAWVVGSEDEVTKDQRREQDVAVQTLYADLYIKAWAAFFGDIQVRRPASLDEELELLGAISTLDSPHHRLLEVLAHNTLWSTPNPLEAEDAIAGPANRRFTRRIDRYESMVTIELDLRENPRSPLNRVHNTFRSVTRFHRPRKGGPGALPLTHYIDIVTRLRGKVEVARSQPRAAGQDGLASPELKEAFALARREARELLRDRDVMARQILEPLLMPPLDFGVQAGEL